MSPFFRTGSQDAEGEIKPFVQILLVLKWVTENLNLGSVDCIIQLLLNFTSFGMEIWLPILK